MKHNSPKNQLLNDDLLRSTPIIPQNIYDSLPDFLKECTKHFSELRERDVVLTSCLVVLSGCFSRSSGKYSMKSVHPGMFGFIIAPAASGKGVMSLAPLLGSPIQKKLLEENSAAKAKYDQQVLEYKNSKKKETSFASVPQKPKYPVLFIPGDSSSAAIFSRLHQSDGEGIIVETEADSLSGAIKQDWGNFSHLLRKAFHHEPVSVNRVTNDVLLYIDKPCLSVLLSGTPDQVPRLIKSAEDGLSSRFVFYIYKRDLEWIDVTPCDSCPDLEALFRSKGGEIEAIHKKLRDDKYEFSLTSEQFDILNTHFKAKVDTLRKFEEDGVMSALARLGLIGYRICMVLSILRHFEKGQGTLISCSDEDLRLAIQLVDVYFEHAMVVYSMLPQAGERTVNPRIRQLYGLLPAEINFSRKKAVELGLSIGISERSINSYLQQLTEQGLLEKSGTGRYKKTNHIKE